MKFPLIFTLAMLAIANGSETVSLSKRDISSEMNIIRSFQDMTTTLTRLMQNIFENIKNHELIQQAKAYVEDGSAQFLPLAEKAEEEAEKIIQQLKPYVKEHLTNILYLIRPLVDKLLPLASEIQTQLRPFEKQLEPLTFQASTLIDMVMEQTMAMIPPKYVKLLYGEQ